MAFTVQQLHDRYTIANKALDSYGLRISDKLANGTASSKEVSKYNLMSAWISFIGSKLSAPINIQGVSPAQVKLPIPGKIHSETYKDLSIGIDNYNGRYIPIIKLHNWTDYSLSVGYTNTDLFMLFKEKVMLSDYPNEIPYIDDQGVNRGSFKISFGDSSDPNFFYVDFPQTSDFNNQKFTASNNIQNGSYNANLQTNFSLISGGLLKGHDAIVTGGVNAYSEGKDLTTKEKDVFNKALEDISIELNISYR
jgi:hypothetical protein